MAGSKAYMNEYMKNRWTARRASAIMYLGGKCAKCGSTDELEFDHTDPTTKLMSVARASSRSESFFWAEVDKCQLLCKPCHKIKSDTIDNAVGHGEGLTGKRNCRCDLCRPLKIAYNRRFK